MKTLLRTIPLFVGFFLSAIVAKAQLYSSTQSNCTNVTGGTININFGNLGTPAGDGTLTVLYHGDLDLTTETFDLVDENNNTIAAGLTTTSQCTEQGVATFTIPIADLINWGANGSIDFSAVGSSAVSASICDCVNLVSGSSASFSVTMTLEYPEVTVPNDIAVTSFVSPTLPNCNSNPDVIVEVVNTGTVAVNSFDVDWTLDGVPQTGVSSNTTLDTINGSGSTTTTINLGSINVTGNNEIIVWTSNPNGTNDPNTVNDTISIVVNNGLSGLYTVGTIGSDFPTVADAQAALTNFGLCGATTLEFPNGNFTGFFDLTGINTTATNTLTIQGQGSANSTLTSSNDFVIGMNNAKHITVKNLAIENTSTASNHHGIFITNFSDSILIDSCHIEVPVSTLNLQPILVSPAVNNQFGDGENVDNLTVSNSVLKGGDTGINIQGDDNNGINSYSENIVVVNNEIIDFTTYGIYFQWTNKVTIENNVIESDQNVGADGIYILDIQEFNISANSINTPDYGMYLNDANANFTSPNRGEVINNMIIAGDEGIYLFDVDDADFFHNSVLAVDDAVYGSTLSNLDVRNNIFVTSNDYAIYSTTASSIGTVDYNLYYNTNGAGSNLIYFGGNIATNLTEIINLDPTANNNSVVGDPYFLSPTDLHVNGPLVANIGDNTAGVMVDIDGDVRPDPTAVNVDLGADEFISPANDASVTAINAPSFPYCSGDSAVFVSFLNSGTNPLTAVDLNFSVNGGAVTTVNWTGNLASFTDSTNAFVANNPAGSFNDMDTLVAWTSNPNGVVDTNTVTDSVTFVVRVGMSGTYTIDPVSATADYASFTEATNDLAARGLCGPVVFEAASGTYTERITLEEIIGASATNTITFTSASGDSTDVILKEDATNTTDNYVVKFDGADYVTFSHMTIEHSAGSSYGRVLTYENESTNNTIESCILIGKAANSTSTNYAIVYSTNDEDNYNTFRYNIFRDGSHGMYWYGVTTTVLELGTVIDNNQFLDQYYYGMTINEQENIEITNNYITSNSSYTGSSYGIDLDDGRGSIIIDNNHIVSDASSEFPTYGIHLEDNEAAFTTPMMVTNNRVLLSDDNATVYGLDVDDAIFANIENNTIVVAEGGSSSRAAYFQTTASQVVVYNNIFANYDDGYAIYQTTGAIQESDYNVFYAAVGEVAYSSGALNTLTNWQTSTSLDANSMELDPMFTDSINMTLCLDTLDGAAINRGLTSSDFQNDPRGASYDIGADEFTALNNFTLGNDFVICDVDDTVFNVYTFDTVVWNQMDTTNNYQIQGAGTFRVEVINACGSAQDTIVVIGQENSTLPSSLNICADEVTDLTTGITTPSAITWSTGANTDSISINTAGQYTVEVIDTVGCFTYDTINVTQSVAVDIPDSLALCEGVVDFLNPGVAGSYQWQDGSTAPTITVNAAGSYSVTVTDVFNCVSADTTEVVIIPQPDASFTTNGSFLTTEFFSTDQPGVNYDWDFGDGNTGTGANTYHIYDWQGVFTVTLTAYNDCDTVTIEQEVTAKLTTGVEDKAAAQSVNIFPNPNNGQFTVAIELSNDQAVLFEVLDLQGRLLQIEQLGNVSGAVQHPINVNGLAQGIYILKATIGDEVSTHRISIQ